jgi:catalase
MTMTLGLACGTALGQVPPVAPGNVQPPAGTPNLTTDTGRPVGSDEHSATSGPEGPTLLQHFYLLEKLARFDRERIPERVVHARGAGAFGEFVVTHDVSNLTRAAFLGKVGEKTPVFARFSTVVLPKGSADSARDVRGFSVKFYTEEGNYDLVGNDIPVFFIRDAIKFPDLIHALKPSPVTNAQEAERYFDFFSAMPETTHMLTWLFSDQGTPASFRQMDGFGVNTFKWVNARDEVFYIKYKWRSLQGLKNNTDAEAKIVAGKEPAALTLDLYEALKNGDYPAWELMVQVVRPEDLRKFDFDPLDATKLWPETMVPFQPVGKMTINRAPENFFETTEQVAFNTGAYVPGIEPSEDKLLQGRNFSYSDTQRYRLGVNYQQLPINQPRRPVANDNQEGLDDHGSKKGDINYSPSTKRPDRLVADPKAKDVGTFLGNKVWQSSNKDPQNYRQAGEHYLSLSPTDRDHLIQNLTANFKMVKNRDVVAKMIGHFAMANDDLGRKLAEANGVDLGRARQLVTALAMPAH